MKAVVYHGPRNVSVDEVPDAKIEKPTDALVRITATNICGSDLHMYEGRTDFEEGRIFGHENVGEVIAVGDAVDKIKVGDMISAPFNVACGHCRNCEEGLTNYCLRANKPGIAGAAYGFADMGPWQGGQPFAPAPGVMGRMGETCPADSAKAMSAVVAELQRDRKWVEFIVRTGDA